jgi:hypothetical protein
MAMSAARVPGTDWSAVFLWALIPVTIACGFVYFALTPEWESVEWAGGLLALVPLEFFRSFVFAILSETYRDYRSPMQAVRLFLLSLAILTAIAAGLSLYILGFSDWIAWIAKPEVHRSIAFALALIAVDGIIGVSSFRGDARRLSVRFQAVADDARDWLLLVAYQLPIVLALTYGVLLLVRESRGGLAWLPNPDSDGLRGFALLYAAFYFFGKAVLLARANTAAFNRTGRRLFASRWIQLLIWQKSEEREKSERDERAAEGKRRAVLAGEPEPDVARSG